MTVPGAGIACWSFPGLEGRAAAGSWGRESPVGVGRGKGGELGARGGADPAMGGCEGAAPALGAACGPKVGDPRREGRERASQGWRSAPAAPRTGGGEDPHPAWALAVAPTALAQLAASGAGASISGQSSLLGDAERRAETALGQGLSLMAPVPAGSARPLRARRSGLAPRGERAV